MEKVLFTSKNSIKNYNSVVTGVHKVEKLAFSPTFTLTFPVFEQ